jgi:hypothetical protein
MERQPSAGRHKLLHTAALDFSHEDYGQYQHLILNAGGGYYCYMLLAAWIASM